MLGGVNFHPTERGIRLERQVRVKLREKYPNIEECGIFLKPEFPFFAASPDGITKDFVIEEEWQVDSVYTDFSKAFDRVRHQLLLEEMSVGIEPARCLWLRS
jgi:hypothetical protein